MFAVADVLTHFFLPWFVPSQNIFAFPIASLFLKVPFLFLFLLASPAIYEYLMVSFDTLSRLPRVRILFCQNSAQYRTQIACPCSRLSAFSS